jgi:hypothetical protein
MNIEIELLNNDSDNVFQKEPNETVLNETVPNETNKREKTKNKS